VIECIIYRIYLNIRHVICALLFLMVIDMINNIKKILASTALVSLIGMGSGFAVTTEKLETPEQLKGVKVRMRVQDPEPADDNTPPAPVKTERLPEPEPIDTGPVMAAEPEIDLDAILNAALAEVFHSPAAAAPIQEASLPTVAVKEEKFPISAPTVQKEETTPLPRTELRRRQRDELIEAVPTEKAPIPTIAIPREEAAPQKPTLSRRELKRRQQDEFAQAFQPLFTGLLGAFLSGANEKLEHHNAHEAQRIRNQELYGVYDIDRHVQQRKNNQDIYGKFITNHEAKKLVRKGLLKPIKK
jgi:hypothetical protein